MNSSDGLQWRTVANADQSSKGLQSRYQIDSIRERFRNTSPGKTFRRRVIHECPKKTAASFEVVQLYSDAIGKKNRRFLLTAGSVKIKETF